jgi:hypothetical protein
MTLLPCPPRPPVPPVPTPSRRPRDLPRPPVPRGHTRSPGRGRGSPLPTDVPRPVSAARAMTPDRVPGPCQVKEERRRGQPTPEPNHDASEVGIVEVLKR